MKKAELVFIPGPGAGHIRSTVEIAKLLACRDQRLSITVLVMNHPSDTSTSTYIKSLPEDVTSHIQFIDLPQNEARSKPVSSSPMSLFTDFINSQMDPVRAAVTELISQQESGRLVGFVIDMFCTPMIDVANEFGVPTYVFFTSGAAFLGFKLYIQTLNDDHNLDVTKYKEDAEAELLVPCFVNPVPAKVFPSVLLNKDGCAFVISVARRFRETKGIIVNTFFELETHAIKSLSDNGNTLSVYSVGPILSLKGNEEKALNSTLHDEIMHWLDDQPPSSVVFLCFGSMGSFKEVQVKEIAHALERSGHRFLWSLRRPPEQEGMMRSPGDYENPGEVLPEGFLERTASMGKVIGWAPQVEVLSHGAVGAFVSHCGWNSILESLWCGVPMAAWPIYAEQQINAFQMVVELGLAAEIKLDYRKEMFNPDSVVLVTAEEIESGIRRMMDGENKIRKKVKEMSEKSRLAMMEGGSSYNSLGSLIEDITDNTI